MMIVVMRDFGKTYHDQIETDSHRNHADCELDSVVPQEFYPFQKRYIPILRIIF